MKTYLKNLRFVLAGALVGWFGSKILDHNHWGEKPIVNDIVGILIVVLFLATLGYVFRKSSKSYKELRKPDPTAEELAGIKVKKS